MLRLVRHVAAKVTADDAVPRWVVLFVELLLDVCGDVLLDVVLLHRLRRAVDSVLLHVLRHVGILYHGLPLGHGDVAGVVVSTETSQQNTRKTFSSIIISSRIVID